ncbi:ABC transporter permease [Oceanobacter mangrovi]|uniref:ABC transporter permease n=1 Tax=Oceanobacter mangrovi TaxID=2862510 RepID=UPI001C8E03FC|nr:ABC transporter permease [Oceanobacter mangrovi]
MLWRIARKSLWHRRVTVGLIIAAMALAFAVQMAVQHIRKDVQQTFQGTVSGVDLIVGARTGSTNLLLSSLFGIGSPVRNVSWQAFEHWREQKQVAWAVPLSMGDSHRGYRVLATSDEFFSRFRYGQQRPLQWADGQAFQTNADVVLGSAVAKQLHYQMGSQLVLSHGQGKTSFTQHSDHPFTVVGILQPTGTPVDQTLFINLDAMDTIHGHPHSAGGCTHPTEISAALLGLKNRVYTFILQRQINDYNGEALMAILPGVELSLLWNNLSWVENGLRSIGMLVLVSSLLGMVTLLLVNLQQRQGEFATLRTLGAGPWTLFLLIEIEVLLITLLALLLALLLTFVGTEVAGYWLEQWAGIPLPGMRIDLALLEWIGGLLLLTLLIAAPLAWRASRKVLLKQLYSEAH